MSDRERWIIYPLLFFALGSSIWSKLSQQVYSPLVRCHELDVVGADDQVKIRLSALPTRPGGEIRLYGDSLTRPLAIVHADPTGKFGVVECHDSEGRTLAVMQGTSSGNGRIAVNDREQTWAIGLSHDEQRLGVSVSDLRSGNAVFLPLASAARGLSTTAKPNNQSEPEPTPEQPPRSEID